MAGKIRTDLIIPFKHIPARARNDATGFMAQTLPMAAMFMRNKMLSWTALFLLIQSYLNEPIHKLEVEEQLSSSALQPPLLRIVFALIAVFTCYIELVFPKASPLAVQKATESAVTGVVEAVKSAV